MRGAVSLRVNTSGIRAGNPYPPQKRTSRGRTAGGAGWIVCLVPPVRRGAMAAMATIRLGASRTMGCP
jgi:hypothetical protein